MLRLDTKTGEFIDDAEEPLHKILYGNGEPPQELGNPGDFYIETESWEIYHKDETWGEGVPLRGKDGEPGLPGKDAIIPEFEIPEDGEPGKDGVGITTINQPLPDKMEVMLSNGESSFITLPAGKDGREIELTANSTHIQWRYKGEEWQNLAPLPKSFFGTGGGRWRLIDLFKKLSAGTNITLTKDDANDVVIISAVGDGTGTVTDVSVVTANGISGSVADSTTTPAITLTLGDITPNSVAATGTVTGSNLSGTNTGDQTITLTGAVTGSGTGSFATTIATPGTLTVSSTNSTATAHTHAITSSSAPGAAASLLATDASGHLGSTGTRIVKGWFTDLTVTNSISGSITGNAATATALQTPRTIGGVSFDGTANIVPQTIQSINEATDTTCFPLFISASGSQSLQPLNNTSLTFNSNTAALGSTIFNAGTGFRIGNAAASGKILIGDGTNYVASTPTYPNASATAGKVIRSDGTNYAASTFTIPDTYAQGDIIYASATSVLSALAKDTNSTRYLSNTGASNNPAWSQIDMTNGVTGILPSMNGGTGNGFTKFSGPTTSEKTFTLPNASDTIACWGIANAYTGANTQTAGSYTFSDNVKVLFGSVGELYSDATNTILNPVSGAVSVGPTTTSTNSTGGSQTGATQDLIVDQIGLGVSPIDSKYWVNFDIRSSDSGKRGALNFTFENTTSQTIQTNIFSKAIYSGSSTNPLNIPVWSHAVENADNSGTSTSGLRSTIDIGTGLAYTQGTHNFNGLEITMNIAGVGGTHTGGTINRYGVKQAAFLALTLSGATNTDWGGNFGNDLQVQTDVKRYVEGSLTVKGDSYDVFNSATTDWDFFVDGTKCLTLDNDAVDTNIMLRLVAGTATAGTAPLKFQSGTSLTTPEAGTVEYDGSYFYFTV